MRIVSLLSVFLLFSCSTMLLDKKKYNYEELQNERSFIHIDLNKQKLYYQDGNRVIDFPISSSSYGIGSEENSFKTPLGLHEISEKIGNTLQTTQQSLKVREGDLFDRINGNSEKNIVGLVKKTEKADITNTINEINRIINEEGIESLDPKIKAILKSDAILGAKSF